MKRKRPEQQIQRAVFDHLRRRGVPNMFAFHPANGGYRTSVEGAILKGLGVVAGTPDVFVIHGGKVFAMELKAAPSNRVAQAQIVALTELQKAGAYTAVCVGLDVALRTLEGWGLLRGKFTDYQPRDDFAKSIEVAYEDIRERKAKGGKGWRE